MTVLQAILRLRAICEHGGLTDFSSPLTAARTHLPSPTPGWWLARALLFPHHVNYHVAHHLYPAVPHYRLPQLHALMVQRGLVQSADVAPIGTTLRTLFANPRASTTSA